MRPRYKPMTLISSNHMTAHGLLLKKERTPPSIIAKELKMSKVWFVTGANSGFGASIAKAALAAGDQVVATARNMDKLRVAFPVRDDSLALVQLDVANASQAEAALAEGVA